jgi:hypothetical protein
VLATLCIRAGAWRESGFASDSTGYLVRALCGNGLAECLSNPEVGRGARGSAVVAAGPAESASEIVGAAVDAIRSRRELVIENAVLRHQVNVLRRRSKRPKLQLTDRIKLSSARPCCRRGGGRS